MKILDLNELKTFHPDKISREMIAESPEMRVALMCLEPGQELKPHKAPMQLLMYCVEGKGTVTIGEEEHEASAQKAFFCEPMLPHGFAADKGEKLVIMAVVTPAEMDD